MTLRKTGDFYGKSESSQQAGNLILTENRYFASQSTPLHCHENPLLYFVTEGSCFDAARGIDGSPVNVGSGVLLPAGVQHSTRWAGHGHGGCLHIELKGLLWSDRLVLAGITQRSPTATSINNTQIAAIARQMRSELHHWDTLSGLSTEALAMEMLVAIARFEPGAETNPCPKWLKYVESRLREQMDVAVDLKTLADEAGVHPSHLVRAFRKTYRCTPGNYVRRLRVKTACTLLLSGSGMSLAEMAITLGFSDQSHFTRVFKREIGAAPGEYRRSLRA